MEIVSQWLNYTILENPVRDLLWFLGIIGLGILIKRGLSFTISRTLYRFIKSESGNIPLADFVRLTRRPFELLITLVMIFWAFTHLTVPTQWEWASSERFGWLMILEHLFFTLLPPQSVGWVFV